MCYWAVSHSAANSWAQINRLSALSRLGHLTSEVSFVNPLVSPSSIALVKNVSTITIPLRSTFGCSQGVHASVEMTFNLHRSLTLLGDGGVYVHVSWEYEQRLTEGDFLRFSKLVHHYSFHRYLRSKSPSKSLPHSLSRLLLNILFTPKAVVFLLLLWLTGPRDLDGTCCFESSDYQQFWSSSLVLTAESISSGWAAVVSEAQAPKAPRLFA